MGWAAADARRDSDHKMGLQQVGQAEEAGREQGARPCQANSASRVLRGGDQVPSAAARDALEHSSSIGVAIP